MVELHHSKSICISGGSDSLDFGYPGKCTNEVYCYDILTDTWTRTASLNFARSGHSSTIIGTSLYISGGSFYNKKSDRIVNVDSIERFPDTRQLLLSQPPIETQQQQNCWELLPVKLPF